MKIRNVNQELLKKSIKLCIGVSIVGVLTTGCNQAEMNINNNNNILKEMTDAEIDEERALIHCHFLNPEELTEDQEVLTFISNQPTSSDYTTINAIAYAESEDPTVALKPGKYYIVSNGLGEIELEINNIEQEFNVDIDYDTNRFECHEVQQTRTTK